MSKGSIAKWVVASIGFTAVAAFTAGVIYQINAIKKLNVNIDEEDEVDENAEEIVEIVLEEAAEEADGDATEA